MRQTPDTVEARFRPTADAEGVGGRVENGRYEADSSFLNQEA